MPEYFENEEGKKLAASTWGNKKNPLVIFLHGGGQTRFAWAEAGNKISQHGFYVIAYDLRGHGDSFWSKEGDYTIHAHRKDLASIISSLGSLGLILFQETPPSFVLNVPISFDV